MSKNSITTKISIFFGLFVVLIFAISAGVLQAHFMHEERKFFERIFSNLDSISQYKNSEDISLEMFDKLYLKDYIKYLFEKELKAKSIKRKVGTLKTLFNFLEFEELIEISPFKKMKLSIKLPKRLPITLDIKELRKFLPKNTR